MDKKKKQTTKNESNKAFLIALQCLDGGKLCVSS